MLILDLDKAKQANVELEYSGYLFRLLQYEEMRNEIDESIYFSLRLIIPYIFSSVN